jgi:hypothetical protein
MPTHEIHFRCIPIRNGSACVKCRWWLKIWGCFMLQCPSFLSFRKAIADSFERQNQLYHRRWRREFVGMREESVNVNAKLMEIMTVWMWLCMKWHFRLSVDAVRLWLWWLCLLVLNTCHIMSANDPSHHPHSVAEAAKDVHVGLR